MRHAPTFQRRVSAVNGAAITALMFFVAPACSAQSKPPVQSSGNDLQSVTNNPELLTEFGKLMTRFQGEVQFPPPRTESLILPLVPESTTFYAALPNYGDAARQALNIFRQELQQSAALREWWLRMEPGDRGDKLEDSVEKFYEISQYLGPETVLSAATDGHDPKVLAIAHVRKPGLKEALHQLLIALPDNSNLHVRVLDPRDLAAASGGRPGQDLLVLVRSDIAVASFDLATLRNFNARLDRPGAGFGSTPFGQRIGSAYEGGATVLAAADVHTMLSRIPGTKQSQLTLQRSGFADMKYFVWEHKSIAGQSVSSGELSFTGPRHGAASWLAAPRPLGSLDFVSAKPMLVSSMVLKSPAQIFDDIRDMATVSNPSAFAALTQFQQMFGISLRDDLLAQLGGEVTLELDEVTPQKATWKAVLSVNDAAHLQKTLNTLFTAMHVGTEQMNEGGITYYTARVPSGKAATEVSYAFARGYLIVASSRDALAEAVRLHGTGESLGKSAKFLAALPPGNASGVSALFYEDPVAMTALKLQRLSPDLAESLSRLAGTNKPLVACAYGDETTIRGESTNPGMDAGVVLVGAAIAIPNLLRSRVAANESSAAGTLRSVVTAQVTYSGTYPQRGYAPDLATLGPNPAGPSYTADHAAMLNAAIANPSCTAGAWCTQHGFRFSVAAACSGQKCGDFVVVATPVDANTGTRSFCSTSDGVIRFKTGPPLVSPTNESECRAWLPIQ